MPQITDIKSSPRVLGVKILDINCFSSPDEIQQEIDKKLDLIINERKIFTPEPIKISYQVLNMGNSTFHLIVNWEH